PPRDGGLRSRRLVQDARAARRSRAAGGSLRFGGGAVPAARRLRDPAGGRARLGGAVPPRGDALGTALFAQHRFDLTRRRDYVIDVARQRAGLLGGTGEIIEGHRHTRGAEAQQVEPHILHCQHARLELVRDELTLGQEIRDRLALALEQAYLSIPFRAGPLMLG